MKDKTTTILILIGTIVGFIIGFMSGNIFGYSDGLHDGRIIEVNAREKRDVWVAEQMRKIGACEYANVVWKNWNCRGRISR